MVAECEQIACSKPIMSGVNATVSCSPLQNLSLTLNSVSNTFKRSLKVDKKVEVRWLESESDMYLKQWQRRHRQLEGIDGSRLWSKSYLLEHYDDWYLTARSILDIDVQYMSSKDYNKFNLEKFNPSFGLFFNRDKQDFLFNMEDSLEDDDFELEEEIVPFQTITLDPNAEYSQEIVAALKSNNLVIKNGKLEYCIKKGKNAEKEKCSSEKQSKKALKSGTFSTTDAASLTADDSASSFPSSDTSPGKGSNKSPRKLTSANKIQRARPTSTRRQMYICEYPGCSYQSDRNFNFLRHKRTHGKQKHDENKKHHNGLSTTSELIFAASGKAPTLNDSAFVGLELGSLNNDILHLSSQSPLLGNELNLNMAQCNSISLADNDQSFSLSNDDYLDRQNTIMKDINSLDHVLADNHFSSLSLDQPFLS